MAYRWETSDSVWLEDEQSGQFALASSKGLGYIDWASLAPNRFPDVAQLLGAALPGGCTHSHIYPDGFAFCPSCGKALNTTPGSATGALPAWWGATSAFLPASAYLLPKHVPHGLTISALPLAAALETRPPEPEVGIHDVRIPKPPNVPCVFAASHFGFKVQRLLALAYSRDVLQYWDPLMSSWHIISGHDGAADLKFTASDYAWLPAVSGRPGDVALVPAEQGLYRLTIDPVGEIYRTELVFAAPLAAAPGAVLRHIACPYVDDDGSIGIWSAKSDASGQELSKVGDVALGVPRAGWLAPLSYDERLIWLHAEGQLIWQAGADPVWLRWPQGWRPRLRFGGATQSRDGRLWLAGHDGVSYSFLELGRDNAQIERIDGARLGFGKLLFRRSHQVKGDPWDSENVEDHSKNDALVLPLMQNFIADRDEPTGLVLRIDRYTGKAEAALDGGPLGGRAFIEWIGLRNVILGEVIGMSNPADCVPFVYDNHLWLHHPKWNEIRGWHLKALV